MSLPEPVTPGPPAGPYWASEDGDTTLYLEDCITALRRLPADSIHACVTDPPYGLEFMSATWDAPWKRGDGINADAGFSAVGMADGFQRLPRPSFTGSTNPRCLNCGGTRRGRRDGTAIRKVCTCDDPRFPNVRAVEMAAYQAWCEAWAAEVYRVLKPGAWLVAFGGPRTVHRLTCGIEDAGFEIKDSVPWLSGQGFPKSKNGGRAIDMLYCDQPGKHYETQLPKDPKPDDHVCPEHPEGDPWRGHGTAFKPANEPIVVARKPMAGTLARNLLGHGTGTLNIDAGRVAHASVADLAESEGKNRHADFGSGPRDNHVYGTDERDRADQGNYDGRDGRFPPNVIFTHSPGCQPAGTRRVRGTNVPGSCSAGGQHGAYSPIGAQGKSEMPYYADADGMETVEAWDCVTDGSCPVAELDRQSGARPGCHPQRDLSDSSGTETVYGQNMKVIQAGTARDGYGDTGGASRFFHAFPAADDDHPLPAFIWNAKAPAAERPRLEDGTGHSTVKPLKMIRLLLKLVVPPGGTVLDPFAGSGTTGEAAIIEGFPVILIEQLPKHADLIVKRLSKAIQPVLGF